MSSDLVFTSEKWLQGFRLREGMSRYQNNTRVTHIVWFLVAKKTKLWNDMMSGLAVIFAVCMALQDHSSTLLKLHPRETYRKEL